MLKFNRPLSYSSDPARFPGIYLFGLPWLVIGLQHFWYATYVRALVPTFVPFPLCWVYITGTAMLLAGINYCLGYCTMLTSRGLSLMLLIFILLVHLPLLASGNAKQINWVRAFQDIALLGAALLLTRCAILVLCGLLLFSCAILILGGLHLLDPDFITAKVPAYLPYTTLFNVLTATVLISTSFCLLAGYQRHRMAWLLASFLLLFSLLYYIPLLVTRHTHSMLWTGLMLDIGIAGGAFLISDLELGPFSLIALLRRMDNRQQPYTPTD